MLGTCQVGSYNMVRVISLEGNLRVIMLIAETLDQYYYLLKQKGANTTVIYDNKSYCESTIHTVIPSCALFYAACRLGILKFINLFNLHSSSYYQDYLFDYSKNNRIDYQLLDTISPINVEIILQSFNSPTVIHIYNYKKIISIGDLFINSFKIINFEQFRDAISGRSVNLLISNILELELLIMCGVIDGDTIMIEKKSTVSKKFIDRIFSLNVNQLMMLKIHIANPFDDIYWMYNKYVNTKLKNILGNSTVYHSLCLNMKCKTDETSNEMIPYYDIVSPINSNKIGTLFAYYHPNSNIDPSPGSPCYTYSRKYNVDSLIRYIINNYNLDILSTLSVIIESLDSLDKTVMNLLIKECKMDDFIISILNHCNN